MMRRHGGCIFAECPDLEAPEARILWHADLDPGTLRVLAEPSRRDHPDAIDPRVLAPWLTVVRDPCGEHGVLSDGWRHIRFDIAEGSLESGDAVILQYHLCGIVSARSKLLPLRRLIDLCRTGHFARSLYPPDQRVDRWLQVLRVHDAVQAGASHSDIAAVLFDADPRGRAADPRSDSLRSRVRRLAREARRLAAGGWRALMRGSE